MLLFSVALVHTTYNTHSNRFVICDGVVCFLLVPLLLSFMLVFSLFHSNVSLGKTCKQDSLKLCDERDTKHIKFANTQKI